MTTTNTSLLYGDSPLATAWLAASLEKKLSKQQYLKTSIINSTRAIEQSNDYDSSNSILLETAGSKSQLKFATQAEADAPSFSQVVKSDNSEGKEGMPLRISGQLLYGVVKIYSRKTRYLYEEVSLALIQLRSTFAISKSLTLPAEQTVLPSLDNVTLKDTITEVNVLYDTDSFDLNKVFGNMSSVRNTQVWTNSDTIAEDEDYAIGDISVGRNNEHDGTTVNFDNDLLDLGDTGNMQVDDNDDFDAANQSIDALARRAERPADDLDDVADFELPLDLNLKDANQSNAGADGDEGVIAGITDFQISAIDNMDLEFTIDETHNDIDVGPTNITQNYLNDIEEMEEDQEDGEGVEEHITNTIKKRKIRSKKAQFQVGNTDVIRTQRKKVVQDNVNEIPSSELKKRQQEYPGILRQQNTTLLRVSERTSYDLIMKSLQPDFLLRIGSTWKSIKRRKLLDNIQMNDQPPATDLQNEVENDIPEFSTMDNGYDFEDHNSVPEFAAASPESIEQEAIDMHDEGNSAQDDVAVETHENDAETVVETNVDDNADVDSESNDFDEYETLQAKNKTTIEVAQELRTAFSNREAESISFTEVVDRCALSENKKSSATRAFFELLVLGTAHTVSLSQDRLFGEITVEARSGLYEKFL